MKNAFVSLIAAFGAVALFSFSSNRAVLENDGYEMENMVTIDTVPVKKAPVKKKEGTTPYDSFGKPKKMDTTGKPHL